MKNKDYVSSKGKRRSNKKPARKPFPIIRFTVVGIAVVGFAYFLMQLKEQSNTDTKLETKASPNKKAQQSLPPPPKDEQWQFIEELENKKVEVSTEQLEDKGPFIVRCTTVRSKARAEALKAKIAFAGFESQVKEHKGTSGTWYRVDLGPYEKKRTAEKTRHELKRNDIHGCVFR